jgi:hypothetical protein
MSKNRLDEPTNGNGKAPEAKTETPQAPPASVEKRRDATDFDEVSIRLWNAYNELGQREDEFLSVITALVQERKKAYLNGQMDLRGRFQMPVSPRIETRSDGSRELVWAETPVKKD